MKPSVLIGIVTHNRADILRRSVASALSQDYEPKLVAVVDDASTDSTPTINSEFPSVRWRQFPQNRGYVAARNLLMSGNDFDYFVSLDDDAWFLERDGVSVAVAQLESDPTIGAVAFDILSPDRQRKVERSAASKVQSFIGCGHVLRRSALTDVGLYDANPGSYGGEEKDLSLRLLNAGYSVQLLHGVHVWHEKTPLQRVLAKQHRSGVANDLAFTLRRAPLLLLAAGLALKIARHLHFASRNNLIGATLAGMGDFLFAWPHIEQQRRPVSVRCTLEFVRLGRDDFARQTRSRTSGPVKE